MESDFDYKISSNQMATVVTFQGKICKGSLEKLEQCRGDLNKVGTKFFIIYFKNMAIVDPVSFRVLTLIQQEIRRKSFLFIVGLGHELKVQLTENSIIRTTELKKTLEEALKTL